MIFPVELLGLKRPLSAHAPALIGVRALYSPSETSRAFSSLELKATLWTVGSSTQKGALFDCNIYTR